MNKPKQDLKQALVKMNNVKNGQSGLRNGMTKAQVKAYVDYKFRNAHS